MILPIALTTAALAALLSLWLALRVSKVRLARKISQGDGGDPVLIARRGAHANFVEYAPMVVILIALVEHARGSPPALWGVAALFLLARIAHPFGMERPAPNALRAGGIMVTWLVLLGLAGWALAIAWATPPGPVELVPMG